MASPSSDRKLAAIMFADIVSYSRLMGANEEEALRLLNDFENIASPIVEKFSGSIIKKNGDQIFCEFTSAKNAVDASLNLQKELNKYNDSRPKDFKLEVRIGIHIGDVVKRVDGDIHGDGVNVAARIQPLASPGGICVSGAVSDALSSHPDYDIISKGEQELKNILHKHSIFQVKTGYETISDSYSQSSRAKTKVIKPILGILSFLLIIGFLFFENMKSRWYAEESDDTKRNIYIHITSNDNYLHHYNIDYDYGNYYNKDEYIISSIDDSLLNGIKRSIFRSISSKYANQDVNIEMSFIKEEHDALEKLFFPKIGTLTTEQLDSLNIIIDNIVLSLKPRIDYYSNTGLPDALIRYFIYMVKDLKNNNEFYFREEATVWGKGFRDNATTQWASWPKQYNTNEEGINKLIEDLASRCAGKVSELRYGGIVGHVIEELDHKMVKIKQIGPGLIKEKMKLATIREYIWPEGGTEILIEDINQLIDYLTNTDTKTIWTYYNADSINFLKYDIYKTEEEVKTAINDLNRSINDIREKINNNYYDNRHSMNTDEWSYSMEVISVSDSIVIAKVTGSIRPVYKVRKNDLVVISE